MQGGKVGGLSECVRRGEDGVPLRGGRGYELRDFGGIVEGIEVDVREHDDGNTLGVRDGDEQQEREKSKEFQRSTSGMRNGDKCIAELLVI